MNDDSVAAVLGYGVLVPAVVSGGLVWLARRSLDEETLLRYGAALAFVGGFVAGYLLLPDWAALAPERHWHWLPYLAVAAGLLGPVSFARGVSLPERGLVWLLMMSAAAWFLVPSWSSLEPSRTFWLLLLPAGMLLTAACLVPLAQPAGEGQALCLALVGTSLLVAVLIAACVSLTYGRIAGVASAALAGVCLFWCWTRPAPDLRGLIPAYVVVVGGIAFVGGIEPQLPLYSLMALPAAPLGLWTARQDTLSRLSGRRAVVLRIAAVGIPLVVGALLSYRGV